jgi:predicted GNAT family N-acyltransferase
MEQNFHFSIVKIDIPYSLMDSNAPSINDISSNIMAWARFCCESFKEKANPPSVDYFLRHFLNDPFRALGAILVAVVDQSFAAANDNNDLLEGKSLRLDDGSVIIGTVRIFYREIWKFGEKAKICGIGEVCTAKAYRRQGVSNALMKHALSLIERSEMKFNAVILHASPWIRPFYAKLGFISMNTSWKRLRYPTSNRKLASYLDDNFHSSPFMIDRINFSTLSRELSFLRNFSSCNRHCHSRLFGPVISNSEYYANWVSSEASTGTGISLGVFQKRREKTSLPSLSSSSIEEDALELISFITAKMYHGALQLHDYGCGPDAHTHADIAASAFTSASTAGSMRVIHLLAMMKCANDALNPSISTSISNSEEGEEEEAKAGGDFHFDVPLSIFYELKASYASAKTATLNEVDDEILRWLSAAEAEAEAEAQGETLTDRGWMMYAVKSPQGEVDVEVKVEVKVVGSSTDVVSDNGNGNDNDNGNGDFTFWPIDHF